jgi:hypothetical protein
MINILIPTHTDGILLRINLPLYFNQQRSIFFLRLEAVIQMKSGLRYESHLSMLLDQQNGSGQLA